MTLHPSFLNTLLGVISQNSIPAPEGAVTVPANQVMGVSPARLRELLGLVAADTLPDDYAVPLAALLGSRDFRPTSQIGSSALTAFQYALYDVTQAVVEGRRGDNARNIRERVQTARRVLAGTADLSRSQQEFRNTGELSDNYDRVYLSLGNPLRQSLPDLFHNLTAPWRSGHHPQSVAEFLEALQVALRTRHGEVVGLPAQRVTVTLSEVILTLGRQEFRVCLDGETPMTEAIPYPLPQGGERWQDASGAQYVIAAGRAGAVQLKTGALLPLDERGQIAGTLRGTTFYRV